MSRNKLSTFQIRYSVVIDLDIASPALGRIAPVTSQKERLCGRHLDKAPRRPTRTNSGLELLSSWFYCLTSLRSKRFCAVACGLGAKNEEQESKTAPKMAQVKERGGFSFNFSRDQNRKSPASTVSFCSETKRKRLLRRLLSYWLFWTVMLCRRK